ncbi:MAG: hypothetical protein M3N09_07615 [Actinomycetota bacterium]|nr:hypothetical protein [Actinomycetota bacterium]
MVACSRGGRNNWTNLAIACRAYRNCNLAKLQSRKRLDASRGILPGKDRVDESFARELPVTGILGSSLQEAGVCVSVSPRPDSELTE